MADQRLARQVNERDILTLLRTKGPSTRAEISRRLSLTPATITRLITDMTQRGLVTDLAPAPRPSAREREIGRPGTSVGLNAEGAFFLGAEIAVGILRFALLDLGANLVDSAQASISRNAGPRDVLREITAYLDSLGQVGRFAGKIIGAGITVPGLVRSDGYILNLPIIGWKDTDLTTIAREFIDLPCAIENNANAAAFGSIYTQTELPADCVIYLKIGTGCGGAVVVNGRPLRGATGAAGELGHLRLGGDGPRCGCGQVGCLETRVNLAAIARSYLGTDQIPDAELIALPEVLARAIAAEEPAALAARDAFAQALGQGLVSLVNVFNPTSVILGGVTRPLLAHALDALRVKVAAEIVPGMPAPEIHLSKLGVYESAIGAAALAHHRTFDTVGADFSPTTEPGRLSVSG